MRTKAFLWMSLLLLGFTCFCSCSEDDEDDSYADNSEVIGTWYLVGASDGWGHYKEYNEGEISITFTPNGEMQIVNTREDQQPIATGTRQYYLQTLRNPYTTMNQNVVYLGDSCLTATSSETGNLNLMQKHTMLLDIR